MLELQQNANYFQKYFSILQSAPLFAGIPPLDFPAMLSCAGGYVAEYGKGDLLLLAGSPLSTIGLVLEGAVQVRRTDRDGKDNLLTELQSPELFGEVFACMGTGTSPVTVIAAENSAVLHLNYRKIITSCAASCSFHQPLIENMLFLMAKKNVLLSEKMEILSKRTTRERLFTYFHQMGQGAKVINLPFDREALAAYLCVERSALSTALSHMAEEGLIFYQKNHFTLLY